MKGRIPAIIKESIRVKEQLLQDPGLMDRINQTIDVCTSALTRDGRIWFCGNGGSAADAQHLAAELSGRFYLDREPLFAEALHVNTSYLTAVANDYSFEEVYARLVRAKGRPGDVLFGLSTSGNSPNILRAFEEAQKRSIVTIGMTGESGGKLKALSTNLINVPSQDTPRIQESHILIGHIICELIEQQLFPK
ncbi:MAG: SIS domain-containing protein [Saprospiraceae bacterium]|nr:SIS domain-containing protein [Saprospiraceae bacterium]MCB9318524.1 SIS domain-containing protein [Lewinellaceae bacterium]